MFEENGLSLAALNCSGNQLHPVDGERQSKVVYETIRLAELLGVDTIVLMSGLPGGGPELVITDKAILNFDNPQHEMQLSELYPGITAEDVRMEVGWPLRLAETIKETVGPTAEELHLIRDEVDPQGMYR